MQSTLSSAIYTLAAGFSLSDRMGAYIELFGPQRNLADQLMEEMQEWVLAREQNPDGIEAEALRSFSSWIAERREIAEQTLPLAGGVARNW